VILLFEVLVLIANRISDAILGPFGIHGSGAFDVPITPQLEAAMARADLFGLPVRVYWPVMLPLATGLLLWLRHRQRLRTGVGGPSLRPYVAGGVILVAIMTVCELIWQYPLVHYLGIGLAMLVLARQEHNPVLRRVALVVTVLAGLLSFLLGIVFFSPWSYSGGIFGVLGPLERWTPWVAGTLLLATGLVLRRRLGGDVSAAAPDA
jgi:hypothetical protein